MSPSARLETTQSIRRDSSRDEIERGVRLLLEAAESQEGDAEVIVTILRELTAALKEHQPDGGALTDDQASFLIESGTFTPERLQEIQDKLERGDLAALEARARLEAITGSLNTDEVAQKLGIDPSRVRHRAAKGNLYSFTAGGRRRFPSWQFTADPKQPVLPGLSSVVQAIPEDMHPASLQNFMATPQEDLVLSGRKTTPAEWLRVGGDPHKVVAILDSFLQS